MMRKKGIALPHSGFFANNRWLNNVLSANAYWHYSWGFDEVSYADGTVDLLNQNDIEYIPMLWNMTDLDLRIEKLKILKQQGKIKYVLPFNEPDHANQSQMTVDQVIEAWPKLESIGVPLCSPAPAAVLQSWMLEFMDKAKKLNLRIDYLCVHRYSNDNLQNLEDWIQRVHDTYKDKYNIPIWITEFAVSDFKALTPQQNVYTPARVEAFMKAALTALDNNPLVGRYAWFPARTSSSLNPALASSVLFNEDGTLTSLGRTYFNHQSYVFNNLVQNGDFQSKNSDGWSGFNFSVIQSLGDQTQYIARIDPGTGGVNQEIDVIPGAEYNVSLSTMWEGSVPSKILFARVLNANNNSQVIGTGAVSNVSNWQNTSFRVLIPAGVTKIKLVVYKEPMQPAWPPLRLDNVRFSRFLK